MSKAPSLWKVDSLIKHASECQAEINGKWVPARAMGLFSLVSRLKLAWLVLSGKADALVWLEGQ